MNSTAASYLNSLGVLETGAITEDILRKLGFKWHELERQGHKHWLLWIGEAAGTDHESLGVELAPAWWENSAGQPVGSVNAWNCWLRSDLACRYHRSLHVRELRTVHEIVLLIEGLTGWAFDPRDCFYGSLRKPESAARLRREEQRLDRKWLKSDRPHSCVEADETRGGALPEHMEAAVQAGKAK